MSSFSLRLFHRIHPHFDIIRNASALNLHQLYSTKTKAKSKQSKHKYDSKSTVDPLYKAPSLKEYAHKSTNKGRMSGWNGTFLSCYNLLNHNPHGITAMMHSFTATSFGVGAVLCGAIFFCSYHSVYSFPVSWFFSWLIIRLFSDIFPLFPKVYTRIIESYVFNEFPVLKHLKFSRKLPNPELQSFSEMFDDRLGEKQKQNYKQKVLSKRTKQEKNIEDIEITDELMAKSSVMVSWKIIARANAKKYGLSWDIVENTSTLIIMPMVMCLLQVFGISDPLVDVLLQNDNIISVFLASNDWIIKIATSYAVATYLNRIAAIPIFKYWCVPSYCERFGPY